MEPLDALSTKDGTLDDFICSYCDDRGLRVDGDVFGAMFSGHEIWTPDEAVMVIERAGELYSLTGPVIY